MNVLKAFNNNEYTTNGLKVFNGTDWVAAGMNVTQNIMQGAELNFEIVSGTAAPENPKENTIWVNTDMAISEWVFSAEQPTNPVEGMVWFFTSSASTIDFNAIKKNNITLYPASCKQYISGTWVEQEAKIYQKTWIDWKLYLYNTGDECTSITGGWVAAKECLTTNQNGYGPVLVNPSITRGTSSITASTSVGGESYAIGGTMRTANKIDLSPYSRLVYSYNQTGSTVTTKFFIGDSGSSAVATNDAGANKVIDLSNINGSYYVGISMATYMWGVTAELTSCYLEV